MKKLESKWFGIWKKETNVFFSKFADHIEFIETFYLFGKIYKQTSRDAFLPDLKTTEKTKLRVIADAYMELHEMKKRIEEEFGSEED